MISPTARRVEQHTPPAIRARIERQTRNRIGHYRHLSSASISLRLADLEREWDIERALQTNFALASTVGVLLTATRSRTWGLLALGVPAFMLQHALQGWCPPLPVMRKLGLRTVREIGEERFALKALRGDFDDLGEAPDPEALLRAVEK